MTDMPALIVNTGILVGTLGAAAIAWWQAIVAARRQSEATTASTEANESRRLAVAAQQATATALVDQLALEHRRDEQANERVDVSWSGRWPTDIADESPITFALRNTGTTDAHGVVMTMHLPQGRQLFDLGDILAGESARAVVRDTEMRGPTSNATMALQDVRMSIYWRSPAGRAAETEIIFLWE
jgi:hypothetical protein